MLDLRSRNETTIQHEKCTNVTYVHLFLMFRCAYNQCNVKCTKLINSMLALSCVSAGMSVVQVYKSNQLWRISVYVCLCIVQQSYSLVILKDAASCLFGFLEEE